jgi:hypothetical protein
VFETHYGSELLQYIAVEFGTAIRMDAFWGTE